VTRKDYLTQAVEYHRRQGAVTKQGFLDARTNHDRSSRRGYAFINALMQLGEIKTATRVHNCIRRTAIMRDACGHHYTAPVRLSQRRTNGAGTFNLTCMQRMCPYCAGTRSAVMQGKLTALAKQVVSTGKNLYMATFTWPNTNALPDKRQMRILNKGIEAVLKATYGATGGIKSWECTMSSDLIECYHLHCHVVFSSSELFTKEQIYGHWPDYSEAGRARKRSDLLQGKLPPMRFSEWMLMKQAAHWNQFLKDAGLKQSVWQAQDCVKISAVTADIREVCKYISGGDFSLKPFEINKKTWSHHVQNWMSNVWLWYRNRPAITTYGSFYGVKLDEQQDEIDETAIALAIEGDICPHCKKQYSSDLIVL